MKYSLHITSDGKAARFPYTTIKEFIDSFEKYKKYLKEEAEKEKGLK